MAAIRSLQRAVGALSDNPVLFLGGVIYAVVVAPQSVLSLLGVPIVPNLLQLVTFFITPFVVAGIIGMADEGLRGGTSFDTFTDVGKGRYVPLLLGNLVQFGIAVAIGVFAFVVLLVVALVVGIGAMGAASGGSGAFGAVGIVGLLVGGSGVLLVVLVAAVVFFFVQFYPIAIVADGMDAIEGFKGSVGLVRANLVSTLGFSVINLLVGLLTSLPVVVIFVLRGMDSPATGAGPTPGTGMPSGFAGGVGFLSTPEAVALAAISLLLTAVLLPFRQTYATAFYRAVK
ncbi:MAG: hypothetical protein ABEJ61_05275 [Haloferacaceae archaeon]